MSMSEEDISNSIQEVLGSILSSAAMNEVLGSKDEFTNEMIEIEEKIYRIRNAPDGCIDANEVLMPMHIAHSAKNALAVNAACMVLREAAQDLGNTLGETMKRLMLLPAEVREDAFQTLETFLRHLVGGPENQRKVMPLLERKNQILAVRAERIRKKRDEIRDRPGMN